MVKVLLMILVIEAYFQEFEKFNTNLNLKVRLTTILTLSKYSRQHDLMFILA
jgi:hypothetical protein